MRFKAGKSRLNILLTFILLCPAIVWSLPPNYISFNRTQAIAPKISESEILRIWMIYVGQGDGILIELPDSYDTERLDNETGDDVTDPTNILIDAGSYYSGNSDRAAAFLNSLYREGTTIEHAIISHHDSDHVKGLTAILEDDSITVGEVYHNGLASYRAGQRIDDNAPQFNSDQCPNNAICKMNSGGVTRAMATYSESGHIEPAYLVENLSVLRRRYEANVLQGVYDNLAEALLINVEPEPVTQFKRLHTGDQILLSGQQVKLEVVWPQSTLSQYGKDWGETINGNSVTLHLRYGAFEMLFTGDHNEKSELKLIEFLRNTDQLNKITDIDVLKVPHHGSKHSHRDFFGAKDDEARYRPHAVLSVASMGEKGFLSNWRHPQTTTIQWSGGSHRFYSTYIHERRFNYTMSESRLRQMIEQSHVLIETDGTWFRVVEISANGGSLKPLSVNKVRRGNGTRWICARNDNTC